MPVNMDHFLQINSPNIINASKETRDFFQSPAGMLKTMLENRGIQDLLKRGGRSSGGGGRSGGGGGGGASAARKAALAQLDVQKKRLMFQQRTGLRDIEQARTEGLRGAINNALERGIFRSGIRKENEATVERETGDAASDLKEDIALSLEALKAQRAGIMAQPIGGGGGGGGGRRGGVGGGLTIDDLAQLASDPSTFSMLDMGGGVDLRTTTPQMSTPPAAKRSILQPLPLVRGGVQ